MPIVPVQSVQMRSFSRLLSGQLPTRQSVLNRLTHVVQDRLTNCSASTNVTSLQRRRCSCSVKNADFLLPRVLLIQCQVGLESLQLQDSISNNEFYIL